MAEENRGPWSEKFENRSPIQLHSFRYDPRHTKFKFWSFTGADPGRPGCPDPLYYLQSQFYFLHCIQCLKEIFLKLNLDFIVAEIRGVFVSVWVYACVCVCESKSWPLLFFVLQRPNFE